MVLILIFILFLIFYSISQPLQASNSPIIFNLVIYLVFRVKNAEVLCLGLVSVAVFMLVLPLFKTTGGILLQMAPPSIPPSALSKCRRQVIVFPVFP